MIRPISQDELLQEFFALWEKPPTYTGQPKVVIVLSGENDKSPEQISRVKYGAKLLAEIGQGCRLVLNGETEQLTPMTEIAEEIGVPAEALILIDCGARGIANTKTQCEVIPGNQQISGLLDDCILVTSTYHIPRALRTAGKFLPPDINFSVVGDPHDFWIHNSFLKVMAEITRII